MRCSSVLGRLRTRVASRGQGGFVIIAGLVVWMLVGGVTMVALLSMTTSATRQASIGSLRAQQMRALDAALETAVAEIQIDPSGRIGLPTGSDDGACQAGLGPKGEGSTYDDGLGNTVLVEATCWGPSKKDQEHRVELTARMVGPGAPDRMTATAELEVVAAKGPGNDVTVLSWDLANPAVVPGDTTTTTSTPPTTTTSTTTTTALPAGVSWTSTVSSEWATGQCVEIRVTNGGDGNERWSVTVPVKGQIYEFWSAKYERDGDQLTARGESWNRTLRAGESTTFGWCATFPAATTTTTAPPSEIVWSTRTTSEWGSGQCIDVTVTNKGSTDQRWSVTVPVKGSIYAFWSARYERDGDQLTAQGESWNQTLRGGGSTTFGWCATF